MKRLLLISLLMVTILLAACGGSSSSEPVEVVGKKVSVNGGEFINITVPELQTMLTEKDFTFINVHIPFAGDIPDTDLSIPFDQLEEYLDQLPSDKDAKLVIYCRSGNHSGIAAKGLVELGFTNVWNLEDGFNAWAAAGLPMEGE
jgi:rhodanese-related sulfurtransferase